MKYIAFLALLVLLASCYSAVEIPVKEQCTTVVYKADRVWPDVDDIQVSSSFANNKLKIVGEFPYFRDGIVCFDFKPISFTSNIYTGLPTYCVSGNNENVTWEDAFTSGSSTSGTALFFSIMSLTALLDMDNPFWDDPASIWTQTCPGTN